MPVFTFHPTIPKFASLSFFAPFRPSRAPFQTQKRAPVNLYAQGLLDRFLLAYAITLHILALRSLYHKAPLAGTSRHHRLAMVVIQDPLFWKRFSIAVHLDEAASSPHPDLKHSYACGPHHPTPRNNANNAPRRDSWLARQSKKRKRNRYIVCASMLLIVAVVAGIVLVVMWLSRHGWFRHGERVSFP